MLSRLYNPLLSRSFFVFGARGTGKTTWLKAHFSTKNSYFIDLQRPSDAEEYIGRPERFEALMNMLRSRSEIEWVVIDEIQKEPQLLDAVHYEIESSKRFKFALTGSSARKLKRGGANLLAGRAGWNLFFPLTHLEMGKKFDLNEALNWGTLPSVLHLNDIEKADYLRSYAQVYLREEILEEQLARNAPAFRRFLEVAAQMNSKILNYSSISNDVGVESPTVKTYFDILEDTYLGFRLPGFKRSIRKQQSIHPKFYLFDLGVRRALIRGLQSPVMERTSLFGECFESFVVSEFFRFNEIFKTDYLLSYLQTKDHAEIDLILDRPIDALIAVEIKSSERLDLKEVAKFRALGKDLGNARLFYLSRDPLPSKHDGVECLFWSEGIKKIFGL